MSREVRVGIFRPDDDRMAAAVELVEALGATPIPDPMLEITVTGSDPRSDADYCIFTSRTGVAIAAEAGWTPADTTICAIGEPTAKALRSAGYSVDLIPAEFSSRGLVRALSDVVDGTRVEVARSDHGSAVLLDGLNAAGAFVHETVLYTLGIPEGAGETVDLAASGDLEVALFTSSLTVEHFLEVAEDRGLRDRVVDGLSHAIVGAIGAPTRDTAESLGIAVDVVPDDATFEELACAAVERAAPRYRE